MNDSLAFLDLNPIHIGFILLLALLLFGPNRLPEVGRQLGNALRDLKRASNEMMNSFNTDHEPDHKPYDYNYPTADDHSVPYASSYDQTSHTDLTDYTIVGQPVHDMHHVDEPVVPHDTIAAADTHAAPASHEASSTTTTEEAETPAGVAAGQPRKEG